MKPDNMCIGSIFRKMIDSLNNISWRTFISTLVKHRETPQTGYDNNLNMKGHYVVWENKFKLRTEIYTLLMR